MELKPKVTMQTRAMKWRDSSISKLTDDCLLTLFNYLPVVDRIRVERVCKRWRHLSKASWFQFKSLNFDNNIWGCEKKFEEMSQAKRITTFESLVKRCGKFLTEIVGSRDSFKYWDDQIMRIVLDNCPNLKVVDIGFVQSVKKSSIQLFKPIMSKARKFQCNVDDDVTDEDLKELFGECEALREMNMIATNCVDGSFLGLLPEDCRMCVVGKNDGEIAALSKIYEVRKHVCYYKRVESFVIVLLGCGGLCPHATNY